tara:strand:- start:2303 stop:2773 length:471 start_codon:yes stop_codon:yes gene_type:complete
MVGADSIRPTAQSQHDDSEDDIDEDSDDDHGAQDSSQDEDGTVHEWYYRRLREIEEEDLARGLLTTEIRDGIFVLKTCERVGPTDKIEMLQTRMQQLDEDMDNGRINEGTYVERSDALKEEYKTIVGYKKRSAAYASRPITTWTRDQGFFDSLFVQ